MSFQIAGTLITMFILCLALAVINNMASDGASNSTLSDRIDKVLEIVGLSSLTCAVISAAVGVVLWIW